MPDDYYVSQYSGEEIDALLASAGAGTVRYDAAQSLTDAQKTQARGNINAAPGGYGLGTRCVTIGTQSLDTITNNGWYQFGEDNTTAPVYAGELFVMKRTSDGYCTQVISYAGSYLPCFLVRKQTEGTWSDWEWVNPPMQLGVEYRTTERYLGKPVYRKMVWGGALPNTGYSNVDIASGCIIVQAACYSTSATSASEFTPSTISDLIPWNNNDDNGINMSAFKNHVSLWCKINRSSSNFVAYVWYIKDTD